MSFLAMVGIWVEHFSPSIKFEFNFPDESVEIEMKKFSRTLHEEVFSRKVGVNPPLVVLPEEVPIISEVINDFDKDPRKPEQLNNLNMKPFEESQLIDSDDEVQPENYFFSNDS